MGEAPFFRKGFPHCLMQFEIGAADSASEARVGLLRTAHGTVQTPGFNQLPPNARAEQMHKLITLAREQASRTIMMHAYGSDNDIQAKATQAKKIKKGLVAPDTVH